MLTMHFQRKQLVIHVAKMQQILFFVHRLMMNVDSPIEKSVLWKCTVCCAIALPAVEMDTSIRAPMIMFNTYMTQFTCSHHGILILEKLPRIWMQKVNLKGLVSYVKNYSKSRLHFQRNKLVIHVAKM